MKIKRYIVLLCALTIVYGSFVGAQTSVFSVGVRAGGQTWLPALAEGVIGTAKERIGVGGALELRYSLYGHFTDQIGLGFALGAGIGYGTTALKGTNTDVFSNTDYLNNRLDYTVTSSFLQSDRGLQTDVSLLLAFRCWGLTVNVGPRLMMPLATHSTLRIDEATIKAYYPQYDVSVTNELITGRLETPYTRPADVNLPRYNLLIGVEVGYEWQFSEQHGMGVQLYANTAVWNNYQSQPARLFISVEPIMNAQQPVPAVNVAGSAEGLLSDRRYLDFGLRAYYTFSVRSAYRAHRTSSRDSRNHHNRYLWY